MNDIITATDSPIDILKEDRLDCKYYILIQEFKERGKRSEAKAIENIWRHGITELTVDECLALKIKLVMSDSQYITEYKWLKDHHYPVFKPIEQLKEALKKYLPGHVEFSVKDTDGKILSSYHLPESPAAINEKCKPVNILEDNTDFLCFLYPKTLVAGSRYPVSSAVAKTLEEATEIFLPQLDYLWEKVINDNETIAGTLAFENVVEKMRRILFHAKIKHGGDGMGSIEVWHEKSERMLPDKGFHYSSALVECYVFINNRRYTVFEEEDPNSVFANRNILQSVADENDKATLSTLLTPIDSEIQFIQGKIMTINVGSDEVDYVLELEAPMFNEKMDKSRLGEEGTGSSCICIL